MFGKYISACYAASKEAPIYFAVPFGIFGVVLDVVPGMPPLAAWVAYGIAAVSAFVWVPYVAYCNIARERDQAIENQRPKLCFAPPFISLAEVRSGQHVFNSNFIHIILVNISTFPVRECKVWLKSITRIDHTGRTICAPISSPTQLITAVHHEPFATISPGVPQHFDSLYASGLTNALFIADGIFRSHLLKEDFFVAPGEYTLHLVGTGENSPSVEQRVKITWRGKWDELDVEECKCPQLT